MYFNASMGVDASAQNQQASTTTSTSSNEPVKSSSSTGLNTKAQQDWSLDLQRVTLLIQFLEYLEKIIYNSYEGTAISIPPPAVKVKPVDS
jgi:hypothetical protein